MKRNKEEYVLLKEILCRHKLKDKEMRFIWKNIKPIFCHKEFQKRLREPFYHHQNITVGEHMISATVLAYKLCKKKGVSDIETKRSMLIAMFHDLYVTPLKIYNPKEYFFNMHAFVHPIEAIVNAITWFPKYFEDLEDAKVIIDGVLHHMYPCPVRSSFTLDWELSNTENYKKLDNKYKEIILCSLNPCLFKNLSLRKSFYFEGRVLIHVDEVATIKKDLKGKAMIKAIIGIFTTGAEILFKRKQKL